VIAVPSFGVMHDLFPGAWRGLWAEKNTLGINMNIGFVACVAAAVLEPRRRRLWSVLAALCLLLVVGSTSKTSLVSCLLGACGLVLVALMRRGPVARIVGSYGAFCAAVLVALGLFTASDVFLAVLGKDATLTGRTKIWAAVMGRIQERPWLGWGYGAVWSDTDPWAPLAWITKQAGFRAYHAHNSWLEQWLGMGVVGLGAWSLYFLETCARALVALCRSAGAYLAIPFLLVYAVTTLTESIVLVFNDSQWLIFVIVAVKLALPDQAPPRPAPRAGAEP
jgi:exopolysaccharide production protein ExoQ